MAHIKVNQEKISSIFDVIKLCPFNAIEYKDGNVIINAACKMCRICIKNGPDRAFELIEDKIIEIDKTKWRGILVYVEISKARLHPVVPELIGKAREMAAKINYPVYCLIVGSNISHHANTVIKYGVDEVFICDDSKLEHFRIEPYTNVFEDLIKKISPSIVLVGGTNVGRSLAPRVAARVRSGLTADCTILDVQNNSDLDQIRPAYGGNIMAHIRTPNHRPQFATVRYKIFDPPEKVENPTGRISKLSISPEKLNSKIAILETKDKVEETSIEEADVIVVAGRALKKEEDLKMVYTLADLLGAKFAATRPLIEAGWADPRNQIGLSGRTVKPKLLIACGVSGSVQFSAGMNGAETIIAINEDKNAPIFDIAHYGIVDDVYEVIPKLIEKIKTSQESHNHEL